MKEDQIYQANLDNVSTNEKYEYIGSCSTKMRDRYENHKSDFKNIQRRTRSTLAEQVWKIKENNCEFDIEWKFSFCQTDLIKRTSTQVYN